MRRVLGIIALAGLAAPTWAAAQATLFFGAGPTIPSRGFADVADLGGMGVAGAVVELGTSRVALGGELFYGRHSHRAEGDRSHLYGAAVVGRYRIASAGQAIFAAELGVAGLRHARRSRDFPGLNAAAKGLAAVARLEVSAPIDTFAPFMAVSYAFGFGRLNSAAYPTELAGVFVGARVPLGN